MDIGSMKDVDLTPLQLPQQARATTGLFTPLGTAGCEAVRVVYSWAREGSGREAYAEGREDKG